MTLGERIKKVRKALDLTQREFGERIAMKQNSVAQIEMGRGTSDQTIFSICKTFNVSETWLRTGEGQMFLPKSNTVLEQLAAEHNLTAVDRALIEKFLSLKPEDRMVLVDYAQKVAAAIADQETAAPAFASAHTPTVEEQARAETEQQTEQVYQQILAEKKAAAGLLSESSAPKAGDGMAKQA